MFDWIDFRIVAAMFKIDNRKNGLKHEIFFKLTIKPPEQNRRNKAS